MLHIQGTAGVAIAGLLGAVRAQGKPMIDFPKQNIVVAGAGRLVGCPTMLMPNYAFPGFKHMQTKKENIYVYDPELNSDKQKTRINFS